MVINTNNAYQLWADIIRISATFFVVWLHICAKLVCRFNEIPSIDWEIANIIDSALRISVPLFIMLSGHLLLGKEESLGNYFNKRFSRILIPWLFWSIAYLSYFAYFHNEHISLKYAFKTILTNQVSIHFWFIYMLIGLYLFIPIFRIFIKNSNQNERLYFLLFWFVAASCLPFLEQISYIFTKKTIRFGFDLKMMSGYTGYLLFGYILGQMKTDKKWIASAWVSYITCFLITAYLVSKYSFKVMDNAEVYYSPLSPFVVIMSVSAFTLIKYYSSKMMCAPLFQNIIKDISLCSFGIYLIHPMILNFLNVHPLGNIITIKPGNTMYMIFLKPVVIFILSYLIIKPVSCIPILKKII